MAGFKTTRRDFLRGGGALAAALAGPFIVPSSALGMEGASAPSDRVAMGFIGLGTMGKGHIFGEAWTYLPGGYIARKDVQILAVCDVWRDRREQVKEKINQFYSEKAGAGASNSCQSYNDFREILDRKDIDAVLIATPIHWHATMSILAAQAGKDVFCEKPTAVCIKESQAMVKAFRENQRIFQAGTQQRSEYDGKFRRACELIRNGRIGQLETVYAYRDGGGAVWPTSFEKEVPIPEGFDWDLWLGPAPKMPYQGRSDAHLFGFGGINWGQHHYDILQWALDADRTGPIEIYMDNGAAAYRYANGVTVYGRMYGDEKIGDTGGGWYIGKEGKIGVDREHLVSDPASILDKSIGPNDKHLYRSDSHSGNFLECVKTRKPAICDYETAHRAASVMLLGGIAQQVQRPLKWDPDKETFINDDEANKLLSLSKRKPWIV
ncbi:MAG: Gfo/Idh/MocA family oxidoreductase [Candidatus Omnitrophota bacterium]